MAVPVSTDIPSFLRLAEIDLVIKPSVRDRGCLVVTFALAGIAMRDLQNALYPRFAALGVEQVLHVGTQVTFHGISAGREADVYAALEDSIAHVNRQRARRWGVGPRTSARAVARAARAATSGEQTSGTR